MDDRNDNQAGFTHAFSTPLTAMRGAIDLLRTADDPVSRELIDTLERNCARLRKSIDALLAHSRFRDNMVEIIVPLDLLLDTSASPSTPPEPTQPQPLAPAESAAGTATPDVEQPSDGRRSVLIIGDQI